MSARVRAGPFITLRRRSIGRGLLRHAQGRSRVFIIADGESKVEIRLNAEDSNLSNQLFDAPKASRGAQVNRRARTPGVGGDKDG